MIWTSPDPHNDCGWNGVFATRPSLMRGLVLLLLVVVVLLLLLLLLLLLIDTVVSPHASVGGAVPQGTCRFRHTRWYNRAG
jgi:hypothetical protein